MINFSQLHNFTFPFFFMWRNEGNKRRVKHQPTKGRQSNDFSILQNQM